MNYSKLVWLTVAVLLLAGCGGAEERKALYLEKAKLSLEAGDLDKARIELKNVLQIDPKDAQAYFQLGDIFDLKKEYRKAFNNYSKALELNPENLEYHAKIGTYLLMLAGDINTAIKKRDLVLGKDKFNLSGLLLKANILLKQNNIAAAKKIAQDIFLKQSGHVDNAVFLSSIYLNNKEYEDSIDVINKCIKKNPNNRDLKSILANIYFSAGKLGLAEVEYKKILDSEPDFFSHYLKLAMFYRKTNKDDKAEEVLRNAIENDKESVNRKLALVNFTQQTIGNLGAINELKKFIVDAPEMADLRLALGKFFIVENMLGEAEKTFKSVVLDFSEGSEGVKSRVYLASLYMKKENIEEAVNIIDDAIKVSPNDSEVLFVKAKLLLIKKDYEGAISQLRLVTKDDPENIEAYLMLSDAHRANGELEQANETIKRAYSANRINVKGLIALARYHDKNKNSDELAKVIDQVLLIDARNYEALSLKSTLLNKRKVFAEAKTYAEQMIELYPDMPNGYIQSVPPLLAENRGDEAVNLLEEGYKKADDKGEILELLVSLYTFLKKFDEATNTVQYAIREHGETAGLYMLQAKIQVASGNNDDAKTSLNKAKDLRPDWNMPYLVLAKIYTAEKQNQQAIEVLQLGLVELKGDLELSLELSKNYEVLGSYNEAISVYEKAYEKNTDNVVLINNLTVILSEHRNDKDSLKRAKQLADKLKSYGNNPLTLDTVGWVYYKIGDYAEAVTILKVVIEKSPTVAVFNYHYGMALYKNGDMTTAKTFLARSLASNKRFRGEDDAKLHLQKLQ